MPGTGRTFHRLKFTHDCSHKCGFSFTVSSDKGNLFSASDLYVGIGKDYLASITKLEVHSLICNVSGARSGRKLDGKR